jgi:FkbM family methyltransferase
MQGEKRQQEHVVRSTKLGALLQLRSLGFAPTVVLDVGAQRGTPDLYTAFPESAHILIEPVAEHEPYLQQICQQLPHATYLIAAASTQSGTTQLRVSTNSMYASMATADAQGDATTSIRTVATIALDDLVRSGTFEGSILLKIDVDGREIEVVRGAAHIIRTRVECIIVEATLFGQINQVLDEMREYDFALYDILEPLYRPLDGALWQVDLVFVRKNGRFRASAEWANAAETVLQAVTR